MRRTLAPILTALLLALAGVAFVAAPAHAAGPEEKEGFVYEYDTVAHTATVVGYTGESHNPAIPPSVILNGGLGFFVTAIGHNAFLNSGLTDVSIPNTVTSIGETAFSDNDLTNVTIPSSVTSIDHAAFSSNELTDVTIGGTVDIGSGAFSFNPDLTAIWFLGDAPTTVTPASDLQQSFDTASGKLRLHYVSGPHNFTNPLWNDYTTVLEVTAGNLSALHMAADQCAANISVTLTADLSEPDAEWAPQCNTELDLNGYDYTARNIIVAAGKTLTIDDKTSDSDGVLTTHANGATPNPGIRTTSGKLVIEGGVINATGDSSCAGIGGCSANGVVEVNGGTVNATGGFGAAGIGGGTNSDGGTITIDGGVVTAISGQNGAGIGGGGNGDGVITTISGGTVSATATSGASRGAGIGGGYFGNCGVVTIGDGADVTAVGDSAVGAGQDGATFGSLSISGLLRIPVGEALTIPFGTTVTVGTTGAITGVGSPSGGKITGGGTIANAGSITFPASDVTATGNDTIVKDHHYVVTFDSQGGSSVPTVTVFAKSFDDGGRTLLTPTRPGYLFDGWNNGVGGPGSDVGADTTLAGSSSDGTAVPITLYAQWIDSPISGLAPTITGTAREGQTLTANEGPVVPASTTFTYQWLRYGKPIAGATHKTYKLGNLDAGRKVSVTITATAPAQTPQTLTSAQTARISSPYARLILSTHTIKKGTTFALLATGLKPRQDYVIWLGGKKTNAGKADSTGTVSRTVKFPSSIDPGTRRVRVSGYVGDTRTFTIYTQVKLTN